jgi:hypothetical protein
MTAEVIDDEHDSGPGWSAERGKPLDTLNDIRREVRSLYWAARRNRIDLQRAKGLAYLLQILHTVTRDAEMAQRLQAIDLALGPDDGQHHRNKAPRALGH